MAMKKRKATSTSDEYQQKLKRRTQQNKTTKRKKKRKLAKHTHTLANHMKNEKNVIMQSLSYPRCTLLDL